MDGPRRARRRRQLDPRQQRGRRGGAQDLVDGTEGVAPGGVGNAGVKPTVAQEKRRLFEVYVYGYEGDAYGKTATVQILEFERPETKFHSVEELKDRVMKDMRYGEEYLKNHPFDER